MSAIETDRLEYRFQTMDGRIGKHQHKNVFAVHISNTHMRTPIRDATTTTEAIEMASRPLAIAVNAGLSGELILP